MRRVRQRPEKFPWLTQLLARRPFKVVAVAMANKMARVAWALLAKGGTYRAPQVAAGVRKGRLGNIDIGTPACLGNQASLSPITPPALGVESWSEDSDNRSSSR